jgi:tRNA threonylcarbamoyladenosine biosynthesis protein TsaE
MIGFETTSPEETEAVAATLAPLLAVGDVVAVAGDLGAGKTTFVRGACRALGVEGPVTSPTFTIGHLYRGRVDVAHLDLYRFDGVTAAEWADVEELFEGTVAFVEWPERADGVLPPARVRVVLEHRTPERRLLVVDTDDARVAAALAALEVGTR